MDELPQKSNSLFYKIRRFWYRIFRKKSSNANIFYEQERDTTDKNPTIGNEKEDFLDALQGEIKKQSLKDSIIEDINNNPSLIHSLSDEKLKQLIELYEKEIKKYELETEKIQAETERILQEYNALKTSKAG